MKSRKHLAGGGGLKSVSCCAFTLVRKHFQNPVTVTETDTSSMQRHLDTAGSY